jgi:hypothetical protein
MRRIIVLLMVAALMAAMLAVTAVPAFATVHPLSKSELSKAPEGTVAKTQDPPGLTPGTTPGGGADEAQPVVAIIEHQPQSANVDPFKPSTFPENGPFKPEG